MRPGQPESREPGLHQQHQIGPALEAGIDASTWSSQGLIDPITNLSGQPIWVFHGTNDTTVQSSVTSDQVAFYQHAYAPRAQASSVSMVSSGYVYVPAACAAGSPCRLLVALHGCLQSNSTIQLAFVIDANLNQYADTNDLVVLYPQAAPTSPSNPNACWDWWGYLGASDMNYAQHGGAQLETIMRIVHALGG